MNKVLPSSKLEETIKSIRLTGKKIVLMNGAYDLIHAGHIQAFCDAKKQGDVLVLLLNSDKSIQMYKGKDKPIFTEKDRIKILSSISYIDFIIVFNEINPKKYFQIIKPDIYCNGSDWGLNFVGKDILTKGGCKIVGFKRTYRSSSYYINKISKEFNKNIKTTLVIDFDLHEEIKSSTAIVNLSNKINIYIFKDEHIQNLQTFKSYKFSSFEKLRKYFLDLSKDNALILNKTYLVTKNINYIEFGLELNMHTVCVGRDKKVAHFQTENIKDFLKKIKW